MEGKDRDKFDLSRRGEEGGAPAAGTRRGRLRALPDPRLVDELDNGWSEPDLASSTSTTPAPSAIGKPLRSGFVARVQVPMAAAAPVLPAAAPVPDTDTPPGRVELDWKEREPEQRVSTAALGTPPAAADLTREPEPVTRRRKVKRRARRNEATADTSSSAPTAEPQDRAALDAGAKAQTARRASRAIATAALCMVTAGIALLALAARPHSSAPAQQSATHLSALLASGHPFSVPSGAAIAVGNELASATAAVVSKEKALAARHATAARHAAHHSSRPAGAPPASSAASGGASSGYSGAARAISSSSSPSSFSSTGYSAPARSSAPRASSTRHAAGDTQPPGPTSLGGAVGSNCNPKCS